MALLMINFGSNSVAYLMSLPVFDPTLSKKSSMSKMELFSVGKPCYMSAAKSLATVVT